MKRYSCGERSSCDHVIAERLQFATPAQVLLVAPYDSHMLNRQDL